MSPMRASSGLAGRIDWTFVAAVAGLVLAFLPETCAYLADELPRYARDVTPLFVYSHSLQHVFTQKALAFGLFADLKPGNRIFA